MQFNKLWGLKTLQKALKDQQYVHVIPFQTCHSPEEFDEKRFRTPRTLIRTDRKKEQELLEYLELPRTEEAPKNAKIVMTAMLQGNKEINGAKRDSSFYFILHPVKPREKYLISVSIGEITNQTQSNDSDGKSEVIISKLSADNDEWRLARRKTYNTYEREKIISTLKRFGLNNKQAKHTHKVLSLAHDKIAKEIAEQKLPPNHYWTASFTIEKPTKTKKGKLSKMPRIEFYDLIHFHKNVFLR